ncbi:MULTISPECIES: gp16 family protein [Acetobacter]|nr:MULTISPECIES: regulatory protein GemA [Acetobacter]
MKQKRTFRRPVRQDSNRDGMVRKLHVGRKQLGLEDADYRALLQRVTGKTSSTQCSEGELDLVLAEMKRLGFRGKSPSGKPHVRKVYALWGDMGPLLRSGGTKEALRAYVQRMTGVSAPEFLDEPSARKVIEGLKAWQKRLEGSA